jgi:hypothetical protein
MSGAILSFARTGNPGWPAFDAKKPRLMMFGFDGKMIDWPNARALPLLSEGQGTPPPATPGRIRD